MKFRLITTVWGRRFADLFLNVTVRSLISEGNADAFVDRHTAVYSIYTLEDTANYLRQSPLFERLQRLVEIQIINFQTGEIDPKAPFSHWVGWRKGVMMARENDEIAFLIIADMLYPKDTLRRWISLFEKGYRAIWTSTTQVVKESAMREIEDRFSSAAPVSMSREEVIDLAIRHLHPKIVCMFRDSGRASRHPEVVFAEVPGEGLAQRVIGSHALCVDPNFFELSDALSPLNRFEAIAFERPTGVGFEPMLKDADLYALRSPMTADKLSNMGSWLNYFLAPPNLIESRRTYQFALRASANSASFRQVRNALGFYACQVRLTGAIYRVVKELRRANCTLAAQLIATAHYTGRLRRHWHTKGAVTAFVPENSAIENWGLQHFETLITPGNESQLLHAVFAHVCEGQLQFRVGDEIAVLADSRVVITAGATLRNLCRATIVAGPIQRDDCTIYVTHKVLLPLPVTIEEPKAPLLPNRWDVHPARLFLTAEATPEPSVPTHHMSIECKREPELQALEPLWRSVARAGYRAVRSLPGCARPAEWLRSTIWRAMHRGGAYQAELLAQRMAAVDPTVESLVSPPQLTGTPSSELLELFRDLQRARAVLTLAEVLQFYQLKVSEFAQDLPALEIVENCIRDAHISVDALMTALQDLLGKAPNFAEAWHELGELHLSKGEYPEAVACFDRCVASSEAMATQGIYALAEASRGMILETSESLEAAAGAYRRAIELGAVAGMVRVAHARVLRRLGKLRDAAQEFDVAMESDDTIRHIPPMPRDFADLSASLAERFALPMTDNGKALLRKQER